MAPDGPPGYFSSGKRKGRPMKRKYNRIFSIQTLAYLTVACFGIMLYFALSNFNSLLEFLSRLYSIISPFIYGAIIAFLLDMPMRYFETSVFFGFQRSRMLALILTYLCALVFIVLLFLLIMPQIMESASALLGNATQYLQNLNGLMDNASHRFNIDPDFFKQFQLSYEDVLTKLFDIVRDMLPDILNISMKVGSGVITILTALIASIYMLASKDKLLRQCRRALYAFIPKQAAEKTTRILHMSVEVFTGFISGKILDSAIIGVICFIGMSLMNAVLIEMPFIPLISVIIGVTNIIPVFGPFIGAIPSAMILLIVRPMSALWFVLFIIVLQQFDGNILGPKILGNSTGLPPLWVLFAIVLGGGLFGFTGMVAGVPAIAIIYTLTRELINNRLHSSGYNEDAVYVDDAPPKKRKKPAAGAGEDAGVYDADGNTANAAAAAADNTDGDATAAAATAATEPVKPPAD